MKKKGVELKKVKLNKATIMELSKQDQNKLAGGATGRGCSVAEPCFTLKKCIIE